MSAFDHQETNNELAHTLGRMEATLERFEQTLEKFDHKLFGNGQPGEITKLDGRLNVVEDFKTFIKGGFAVLGTLLTLLGGTLLYHLFGGR